MRRVTRFGGLGVMLAALLAVGGALSSSGVASNDIAARKARRVAAQRGQYDIHRADAAVSEGRAQAPGFDRSIVTERATVQHHAFASGAMTPPPHAPGFAVGLTAYDLQHFASSGHQVARTPGADVRHFIWTSWDRIPANIDESDRYVAYAAFDPNVITIQFPIAVTDPEARGGAVSGDAFEDNSFHGAFHQFGAPLDQGAWHVAFPTPGSDFHINEPLPPFSGGDCNNGYWPQIATSHDGDHTIHVIAHTEQAECLDDILWYWRHDGAAWTGPVAIDNTPLGSYVLADDPTGDKLAVAVHTETAGLNNIAYYESSTDGAGWIAGSEPLVRHPLTNYSDPGGPQAWLHLSTCYDNGGTLHIAFDEQRIANLTADVGVRHWNSARNTIRPVVNGYWDAPYLSGVFDLNLAKLTMGIGDGGTLCQGGAESNNNYVYITYTQFAGPTPAEQADVSVAEFYNGELYLTASSDGGNTWTPPANLTNTKTPGCNPGLADTLTGVPQWPDNVCRSEHWATIGMVVHDIDIFFISDQDAGAIPYGEGTWQMNTVMYRSIPGGVTDAPFVCPALAPNFEAILTSDPACEFHSSQSGAEFETLNLANLGNAPLSGTISVVDFPGAPTLSVDGGGSYAIAAGDPDLDLAVTMSANNAPEGVYSGQIMIEHNDLAEASPRVIPVEYFIFNDFFCPGEVSMPRTGAGGATAPGSLTLVMDRTVQFALGMKEGGLWRHADSSSSIYDGSLLIAHGTQGPDTTVYLRFFDRATNGQNGFLPLADLEFNTAAYGTGTGCAIYTTRSCTRDSAVGLTVQWGFPQDFGLDEFIVARYQLYRHQTDVTVNDLAVGLLVDEDVLPAARLGSIQAGVTNEPGSDAGRKLVWQGGSDTAGAPGTPPNTATRFRAGMAFPDGYAALYVGDNITDIRPGGGPTDGFLYSALVNRSDIELFADSATDLYTLAVLDRGRSIAAGETLSYTVIFVSDTLSESSLKATVDTALVVAKHLCWDQCSCPCGHDPMCDGVISNSQDVVAVIDVAFRGDAATLDPQCPSGRTDVDASGATDGVDVVKVINVALRGQPAAANYVDPCL